MDLRKCVCPAADSPCACEGAGPGQQLRVDASATDCYECMRSKRPCACADPGAMRADCMCYVEGVSGLVTPCPCDGRGSGSKQAAPEARQRRHARKRGPLCGKTGLLGLSSSCDGTQVSTVFQCMCDIPGRVDGAAKPCPCSSQKAWLGDTA